MGKEEFDPKDEQYKEVADLPPEHQEEFMDIKNGGFVSREVVFNKEKAEEEARKNKILYDKITKLPINKNFEITYVLNERNDNEESLHSLLSGKTIPHHKPFRRDACIEQDNKGDYFLNIDGELLLIKGIDVGLTGRVVTIKTSEKYFG